MGDPVSMGVIMGMQVLGGVMQGNAAKQSAASQSNQLLYQAQISRNNAALAEQQGQLATAAGEQQATQQGMKTRATVGAIKTAQAAGNIDVNTGSAVDVRSSAAELGELDALTIRSNAARTKYGYDVAAQSDIAQAGLDEYGAAQARKAGKTNFFTSLLGGATSAGSTYGKFSLYGGSSPNYGAAVSQAATDVSTMPFF